MGGGIGSDLRRHIETMTKKITHCPDCGSTWYDDGFTAECPQCRVRRLEEENRNHKQTLAGIAAMNPTEECDRAIQWAKDGLSGYTMSADATVKCLQDKVKKLETELEEWQAKTMKARMEAAEFEVAFDKEQKALEGLRGDVREIAEEIAPRSLGMYFNRKIHKILDRAERVEKGD